MPSRGFRNLPLERAADFGALPSGLSLRVEDSRAVAV